MSRLGRGKRASWWLTVLALSLVVGAGVAVRRKRASLDPNAAANSAYSNRDWSAASRLARQRLRDVPGDLHALQIAARAAARQDQDERALTIYRRVPAEDKDAEDFFLEGRSLFRLGQTEPAYAAYETAIEKDANYPEALAGLAGLYMQVDRFHAAARLAEGLTNQPEWEARAQVLLGTAMARNNDFAGAARALTRWSELDPHGRVVSPQPSSSLRKIQARMFLRSGQSEKARQVVEQILAQGPDSEAEWLLSRCFIQSGNWKSAGEVLARTASHGSEFAQEFEPAPYAGEASCASCHQEQFDAVLASRHAGTFYRARDLTTLPLPGTPLTDPGNPQVLHRFRRDGDSIVVETSDEERIQRAVIDYAFGSLSHFTTLVGRDEALRPRMVRLSYYRSPRGSGWDLATGLPLRPSDPEEYLGKKMFEGDGLRRCLFCHTTNLDSILHETGPEAADHSIGCERCHGPGTSHIAAVEAEFQELAMPRASKSPRSSTDKVCAECHGIDQPRGLDVPRTDPLWLRFQSLTLTWSRCYTESDGKLGCVTCHDPHRDAEAMAERNESKCLACHSRTRGPNTGVGSDRQADDPTTGQAAPGQAGSVCPVNAERGCIDCHLPRLWVPSTHSFKSDHFIRIREGGSTTAGETRPSVRSSHE